MTPTVVHRYAFTLDEAARALLADEIGDCLSWDIRIVASQVIVDVIAPAVSAIAPAPPPSEPNEIESIDAASSATTPPARKGGPLAMKAGILCSEGAFQVWLGVKTPDAAKAKIYERCGVGSRVDLDYDDAAAAKFKAMASDYDFWCEYGS